jgi:hypothetical protein
LRPPRSWRCWRWRTGCRLVVRLLPHRPSARHGSALWHRPIPSTLAAPARSAGHSRSSGPPCCSLQRRGPGSWLGQVREPAPERRHAPNRSTSRCGCPSTELAPRLVRDRCLSRLGGHPLSPTRGSRSVVDHSTEFSRFGAVEHQLPSSTVLARYGLWRPSAAVGARGHSRRARGLEECWRARRRCSRDRLYGVDDEAEQGAEPESA